MKKNENKIGDRIKRLRLTEGLTQKQFAERIGFAIPTLSRFEGSVKTPSYTTILRIIKSFETVSLEWLLRGEGNMYRVVNDSGITLSEFLRVKLTEEHAFLIRSIIMLCIKEYPKDKYKDILNIIK